MGLPGAGKSTLAETLHQLIHAEVVSSDSCRIELFNSPTFSQNEHDALYRYLDTLVEKLLCDGKDVVYDANLNRYEHRAEKYLLASKLGVKTRLWWVQTAKDLAKSRRISEQNHILIPEGETPEKMFERIALVLQAPDNNEPYTAVDGTKIDAPYISQLLSEP